MCYNRPLSEREKKLIIETYYEFPTKEISIDMLKEARRKTARGLMDIKMFLLNYIDTLR